MKRSFSFFLALRYLKPKRSFVSLITVISVLGVTLGIGILIVVIAVMTGFDRELRNRIIGFEPHLKVSTNLGAVAEWQGLQETIEREVKEVEAVSPFVMGPVLVQFHDELIQGMVRGVQPNGVLKLVDLQKYIKKGRYELDSEKCVIGEQLAEQLGIEIGDKVSLIGPGHIRDAVKELERMEKEDPNAKTLKEVKSMIAPVELEVVGMFLTGRWEYDTNFVIVSLPTAQEVYDLGDSVHGLAMRIGDPELAERFKPQLANTLGERYVVTSWVDSARERLEAIAQERVMMMMVLMMIIVVAAFSISNTLITVIVQKKREIGVIKALGASPWQIIRIFLGQGLIVGVLGNVFGLLLGWTILSWRNEIRGLIIKVLQKDIFPQAVYELAGIPSAIATHDIISICVISMAICIFAAWIPARFAAKLDPVKALREE